METNGEKFNKFSHIVMKEADEKKKEIIAEAEKQRNESISSGEIEYLKQAYERIQEAVRKIDKEINEEVSKAILESKQALFNRRDEIINAVFRNVTQKLIDFKGLPDYQCYIKDLLREALSQVGQGEIEVLADTEDMTLLSDLKTEMGDLFNVSESGDKLLGGFLITNRTRGILCDFSFATRLNEERSAFLEKYGVSID